MDKPELLYSIEETFSMPFSIERHIHTFVNYCECVIDENGTILYAVPSHERKLMNIVMEKYNMTLDKLTDKAEHEDGQWDWINWLMRNSKCMCVYTCGYAIPDDDFMTDHQHKSLQSLIDSGLVDDKRIAM